MQIWNSITDHAQICVNSDSLILDETAWNQFLKSHSRFAEGLELPLSDLVRAFQADPWPLPTPELREQYFGEDHVAYWISGYLDALRIRNALGTRRPRNILDFGCSTGRILRHLLREFPHAQLWGIDIQRAPIEWLRKLTPAKNLRVFHSTSLPYLPFESESFDLISAFSVFTHIEMAEESWLLELRRLLKPKGVLYLSFLSEAVWSEIKADHVLYGNYSTSEEFGAHDFTQSMPAEKVVWHQKGKLPAYGETVFQSRKYIMENWSPFFSETKILPFGHNFQDVVVLTK